MGDFCAPTGRRVVGKWCIFGQEVPGAASRARSSKEKIKSMELMTKTALEEFKVDKEDEREVIRVMKEMLMANMKENQELDMKGLDALVKMAIAQQKETANDEER